MNCFDGLENIFGLFQATKMRTFFKNSSRILFKVNKWMCASLFLSKKLLDICDPRKKHGCKKKNTLCIIHKLVDNSGGPRSYSRELKMAHMPHFDHICHKFLTCSIHHPRFRECGKLMKTWLSTETDSSSAQVNLLTELLLGHNFSIYVSIKFAVYYKSFGHHTNCVEEDVGVIRDKN